MGRKRRDILASLTTRPGLWTTLSPSSCLGSSHVGELVRGWLG